MDNLYKLIGKQQVRIDELEAQNTELREAHQKVLMVIAACKDGQIKLENVTVDPAKFACEWKVEPLVPVPPAPVAPPEDVATECAAPSSP